MIRPLLLVVLLMLGLAIGLLGAFEQAGRWVTAWPWGQIVIPWGMALMLLLLVLLIRGGAWLVRTRFGGWVVLAGWLACTIYLTTESPSGDLVLAGGTRQWVYVLAGVVLGSVAATFPVTESQPRLR